MNTVQIDNQNRVMWTAVALAIFTAMVYVLIALNILSAGDLQMNEKPAVIIYVAAGCYLLGGLLIFLRNAVFHFLARLSTRWSSYSSSICIRPDRQ